MKTEQSIIDLWKAHSGGRSVLNGHCGFFVSIGDYNEEDRLMLRARTLGNPRFRS